MIARSIGLLVSLLMSLALLAQPPLASAEGGTAEDVGLVHFQRGVDLYREGSYDGALVEFERFLELTGNYKILYNIAQVQVQRHEYVEAVARFEEYLRRGAAAIPAERRQSVKDDIKDLSYRIAKLDVDLNVDGAQLFIDGRLYGTSPFVDPLQVNVGTLRLRIEKVGYSALDRTVSVVGGERTRVILKLVEEPAGGENAPSVVAVPVGASAPRRNYTPFWVGLSTTVALAAATTTFGILSLSARSLLDERLGSQPGDSKRIESARDKLRLRAMLTDGFGIATLLAAGTTVYFLLDAAEERPAGPATAFGISPGAVRVSGTF